MAQRVISQKQIEAILKLDGPQRYDHFIKHVVDCEQAWGLYRDGWAMGSDDSGESTFQIWPAKEYAALCAEDEWAGYKPTEIPLQDLLHELLPKLKGKHILPGIFRTPTGHSVMPSIEHLIADLQAEVSRYREFRDGARNWNPG